VGIESLNEFPTKAEVSRHGMPVFDTDSRGLKGKTKSKMTASDDDPSSTNGKRKRGIRSISITPSTSDDDVADRDSKRRKMAELSPPTQDKMKKVFLECFKVVLACEDETGRRRCELFKELPDKRDYPDYYNLIRQPISLSIIRRRINGNTYNTVAVYRADWKLMFDNARTYNQPGSWVCLDAEEMEKVFEAAFNRLVTNALFPSSSGTVVGYGSS